MTLIFILVAYFTFFAFYVDVRLRDQERVRGAAWAVGHAGNDGLLLVTSFEKIMEMRTKAKEAEDAK